MHMGKDAHIFRLAGMAAAIATLALCGGCRHIKAPHPPKEPQVVDLKTIDDPGPSTRPTSRPSKYVTVYETYVVRSGDNLGRISQKVYKGNAHNNGVIQDANPGLDPRKLTVGQVIRYPVKKLRTPATAPTTEPTTEPAAEG